MDIDCGYRGPARTAPVFHVLATFHSSARSTAEAPDLMLWLSDPRGDPPVFEIDAGLLKPLSRGTRREIAAHCARTRLGPPAPDPVMTATPDTKLTPCSPARITVRRPTSHADPTAAISAHRARTAHSKRSAWSAQPSPNRNQVYRCTGFTDANNKI